MVGRSFTAARLLRIVLVGCVVAGSVFVVRPSLAGFPGGNGKIVFERFDGDDDEIFVVNPDGTGLVQLTFNDVPDRHPTWSADGTRIAFSRLDVSGSDFEVWTMDADGTDQTQVTTNDVNDHRPSWSPVGSRIVFVRDVTPTALPVRRTAPASTPVGHEIWTMNADGTEQTQLTFNDVDDERPAWSPDGTKIAFDRRTIGGDDFDFDIWVMNADGTEQSQLTNNDDDDHDAAWSPDGRRIAFAQQDFGESNNAFTASSHDIVVMNADGTEVQQVTNEVSDDTEPAWSPDGSLIVFARTTFTGDATSSSLATTDPQGGALTTVTTSSGFDGAPDWQPVPLASPLPPTNTPPVDHTLEFATCPDTVLAPVVGGATTWEVEAVDSDPSHDVTLSTTGPASLAPDPGQPGAGVLSFDPTVLDWVFGVLGVRTHVQVTTATDGTLTADCTTQIDVSLLGGDWGRPRPA